MIESPGNLPPWKSKSVLNRAGEKIRKGERPSDAEIEAMETWRAAHSYVLNTFKPLIWRRVRGKDIIVAQRLKRHITILDKLSREPRMNLARMDDIAGTRLIFKDIPALEAFRNDLHNSNFKHQIRHSDSEKYNYIKNPKPSGYRGIHEIYTYNVNSEKGKKFNGLYIEIQFRTLCQHAWATAVEVVSRITENQPKFDRGDDRHREFFRLSSEIIARAEENTHSCKKDLSNKELCTSFKELDNEIGVVRLLNNLPVIELASRTKNNIVLQLSKNGGLKIHKYRTMDSATGGYFELEKAHPQDDIVLVGAMSFEAIRSAYRNYFQNTHEFIQFISAGLKKLDR